MWWNRVSGLNTAYFEDLPISPHSFTYSSSPTLYLSKSVKIILIQWELTNLCYMGNGAAGPKIAYFENHRYFSQFLHIPVVLHCTFPDHSESCYSEKNWRTYKLYRDGFSNFWFWPKKAAESPSLLQTAINNMSANLSYSRGDGNKETPGPTSLFLPFLLYIGNERNLFQWHFIHKRLPRIVQLSNMA